MKLEIITEINKAIGNLKKFSGETQKQGKKAAKGLDLVNARLKKIKKNLTGMKGLMAGALGTAAVIKLGKSFLDAAVTVEIMQVRLQILLGTVEEGNRLFENMVTFASQVPFEFEEIMQSATALAGIMEGGVDEISAWMPLIADLAGAIGFGFEETTIQVQRMMAAGAASADRFREKGVLAMLGFDAGVKVSADETKRRLIEAWTAVDSKFRGGAKKLAGTWTGTMSMIKDTWFRLRTVVMNSGLFEFLKDNLSDLDVRFKEWLENNEANLAEFSKNVVSTIQGIGTALSGTVTFLKILGGATKEMTQEWSDAVAESDKFFESLGDNTDAALKAVAEIGKLIGNFGKELNKMPALIAGDVLGKSVLKDKEIFIPKDAIKADLQEIETVRAELTAEGLQETADAENQRVRIIETASQQISDSQAEFFSGTVSILSQTAANWRNYFSNVWRGFKQLMERMLAEFLVKKAIMVGLDLLTAGQASKGKGFFGGVKSFLGFAQGGFTGKTGGVVHPNEYVVPEWMISQFPQLISSLEGMRQGGNVDNSTINLNATINSRSGQESEQWFRDVTIPMFREAKASGAL